MNESDDLKVIQKHVEIMTLAELARQQLEETSGVRAAIIKIVGSFLQGEFERSSELLKSRRIWIKNDPEREGLTLRFTYSIAGRRGTYEIERATLRSYMVERVEDYSSLIEQVHIPWPGYKERFAKYPLQL
ncbi:hypothetical protein SAMN05216312_1222 [Cohnella sp. OV330]|uniref:hypothetical protein n=1 Tax=Cohnella sp. OV330 TaxID=1855288 RepID=UPI0008EA74E5|nr:hypothetical protein [Cohnella sp. OV330]SFB62498.1 hypothetical protein SAMN05216312_1222 [Cohnella sp. OV330]